jgi:hypothetical protein
MGIEKFIKSVCVQTAVYWGNPRNGGYGKTIFDDPVEISVRWDVKNELIMDADGNQVVSNAEILVTQDLEIGGFLYLGSLDDLSSDPADPLEEEVKTYEIKQFSKVSMPKSLTEFVRKVWV